MMPSEHTRRKDDTWTSEELNKALKGSKHEMLRKRRGDEEGGRRHHRDDMNKRESAERSHGGRDENDKKSSRFKDRGDSPDGVVALTEEERERLRQERRAKRGGGKEEKKTRPKESKPEKITDGDKDGTRKMQHRDGDVDHHRERIHHLSEEPENIKTDKGERKRYLDDGDGEHRRHKDAADSDGRKQHHRGEGSLSRSQNRQQSYHDERQKIIERASRHQPRKNIDDNDDEEERERRRQERREKRGQERNIERDRERSYGSGVRNKRSEREQNGSQQRNKIDLGKDRERVTDYKDRDRNRDHKDRDKDHKDRDRDKDYKDRDRNRDHKDGDRDKDHKDRERDHKYRDRDRDHKDRDRDHKDRDRDHKDRDRDRDRKIDKDHRERNKDRDHKDRDRDHKDRDRDRDHNDRDRDRDHKDRDRDRDHNDRDRDRDRRIDKDDRERKRDRDHKDRDRDHKESSHEWKDQDQQEEPEKRNSRVGQEAEKQGGHHYKESSHISFSSADQLKSENPKGASDDDGDEYSYEEDFEDYEDDFEGDERGQRKEDSEVESVLRALNEENSKSRRFSRSELSEHSDEQFRKDNQEGRHQVKAQPKKSFINFVSAKQRVLNHAVSGKARKRFDDLSRLIELDVVKFDMFDLQPVKEYEMYIRSFGRSDTKQAYVQTRDDDIDKDVQTEETETLSKWTQHPPDEEMPVGGEGISVQGSEHRSEGSSKTDMVKLSQFLDTVGRIIFTIFDEESKCYKDEDRKQNDRPSFSFCNSSSQLGKPNFLNGHQVIALSFCQSEPDYLLSVHSTSVSDLEKAQLPLHNLSFACVWKLSQPDYPYRICGSQVRMTCACFSPTKASLVFAGMSDGSIALWDLREPSSDHRGIQVDGNTHLVRFPTYNTAGVLESENHHSPVVAIVPIYSSIVGSHHDKEVTESSSGLSFQLASVEEKAVVNLWVAAEVAVSDPAGSEADLGLSPGGKLKLLRSSSIGLSSPNKYQSLSLELRALNLHLDPHDLNHFYVGTDIGHIIHGVRFGKRAYPHSHCSVADFPVPVVSLDFSPFGQAYFLVGCEDGTLFLFNTKLQNPIATWRGFISGERILYVRWSHSRAAVFFVLDNSSTVFTFDLIENGLGPVRTDKMTAASVTSMEVGEDPNILTPGTSRPAYMAVAQSNGMIEMLMFTDEMREQQPLEEEFLSTYMDRC